MFYPERSQAAYWKCILVIDYNVMDCNLGVSYRIYLQYHFILSAFGCLLSCMYAKDTMKPINLVRYLKGFSVMSKPNNFL